MELSFNIYWLLNIVIAIPVIANIVIGCPKDYILHKMSDRVSEVVLVNQGNRVLFVLRFYGPVNPMGSCRARSVYLTTRLLGRLSPLSG